MLIEVVVAGQEEPFRRRIQKLLSGGDVIAREALSPEEAGQSGADMLLLQRRDLRHPAEESMRELAASGNRPAVVVLQDEEDMETRARLLAAGAFAVLNRKLPDKLLEAALASQVRRCQRERRASRPAVGRPSENLLQSKARSMLQLLEMTRQVAPSDSTLLILGETGTGKEWLAKNIHHRSRRKDAEFLPVHCAALPESLLESELFGSERGAFTGAERSRRGLFEQAHRGTLFLDEVGDIPLGLQVKLLRILQERRFRRLGGEKEISVDIRLIAATHRDLETAVSQEDFRADLFHRLSVITLEVPPLRERREDIPELAEGFLSQFGQRLGRPKHDFTPQALEALVRYRWPGNVRELANVVERAVLLSRSCSIGVDDLPASVTALSRQAACRSQLLADDWREQPYPALRRSVLESLDSIYFNEMFTACRGRVREVAERSGLDPRSVHEKMKRLGLRKEDFR
ncbi:MAG TPA: sigma-54 dependent transcriptional regulator [Acidobacteriota bacterium]|nr:sigma-54 dependent transcriptional regulator [Acidobacteriota bacterium]